MIGAFLLGVLLQISVVIIPVFANIFEVTPLNGEQWLYTIGISLLPVPIMELQKLLNREKLPREYSVNMLNRGVQYKVLDK